MTALNTWLRRTLARPMVRFRTGPTHPAFDLSGRTRIALVKLDGIGDFVLATTFLQLCRRELPEADITLFCRKPVGNLARHQFPGWTVVELPSRSGPLKDIYLQGEARRAVKSQRPFDLLVDLRSFRDMADSAVSSWIPARTKIALENAYLGSLSWVPLPSEKRIYDVLIPLPQCGDPAISRDLGNHRRLSEFLFPATSDGQTALPRLRVDQSDREELGRSLSDRFAFDPGQPFLLVCPGAGAKIRRYPIESLSAAINRVLETSTATLVLAGSREEKADAQALVERIAPAHRVVDLTGATTLAEHLTLVSMATAVLCMETSHAHIAGALRKPAVVVIGGGHYGLFAPWGANDRFRWLTNRIPCFGCHWKCIYEVPKCIHDVPSDVVADHLIGVLHSDKIH